MTKKKMKINKLKSRMKGMKERKESRVLLKRITLGGIHYLLVI